MFRTIFLKGFAIICLIHITTSKASNNLFLNQDSTDDIIKMLNSKGYLPRDSELSQSQIKNNSVNEASLILTKLSDDDLVKLLSQDPKKEEFSLNDIASVEETKIQDNNNLKISSKLYTDERQVPYFKLDHKEVDPYADNPQGDPKYNALKKINNMLYAHPRGDNSEEDDEKKEIMFDILVAQLKSLCCKKPKSKTNNRLKPLLEAFLSQMPQKKPSLQNKVTGSTLQLSREYIFLVINDEIKTYNDSDELVVVDPDSLANNSRVLLLGPLNTPLDDMELKLVVKRITQEIERPEYIPLLQKLSAGSIESNMILKNSFLSGPETRRYIKPHRCNHQSKLARIYGGPKWLICTGYLNLNKPSLYD